MEILKFLAGPLIGAVIGYCTNYIAVKMLFYPRKEIRVFGRRLPFTPGAIPKGQPRLAKAVGTVIENRLLTREDIESNLMSDTVENKMADAVMGKLSGIIREELCDITGLSKEDYDKKRTGLCRNASEEIIKAIQSSGVTETVLREIAESLREKADGTAWHLLINSKTIGSVMEPAQQIVDRAIDRHGAEHIAPILETELTAVDGDTGLALLARFEQEESTVRNGVIKAYRKIVGESAEDLLKHFQIAALVEDKINAMSVDELEKLVWGVMRKELNTIINLGAVIGLVLGLLNAIFR